MNEKYKYYLYIKIIILLNFFAFYFIFNNNTCFIKKHINNSLNDNKSIHFNYINNETPIFKLELIQSNSHIIKLLIPSKQCVSSYPTVYFTSKYREINKNEVIIDKRNKPKKKIYFLSFFSKIYNYRRHINFLKESGFIHSLFDRGYHNLYIGNTSKVKKTNFLSKYIRINRFPYVNYLFQKDNLYKYYHIMKNYFNNEFNYMPETYYYPFDKDNITKEFQNYSLNINNLWLVKPIDLDGGRGIFLFKSLKMLNYSKYVITKYVTNINLIKNKKYDLRLYVLITSLKPLRIYLYKDGLVRIASKKYSLDINSMGDKYIHFTNTDINKYNKDYIFPRNYSDYNANIWNLKTYQKYLNKNKVDWNNINEKIIDIIIKTIISVQEPILDKIEKDNLNERSFFNIVGFDILITDEYEPVLLEVNYSPSVDLYNELDKIIKTNLLVDTFNLVGIIPFSQEMFNNKDKTINIDDNTDNLINNAFCEFSRPKGDYKLIFPLKENINKYKKFFKNKNEINELFWQKLK